VSESATPDGKYDAGVLAPVIDRNRCEAKQDCLRICPYDGLCMEARPEGAIRLVRI
jgi:NAD-dependent dihydropyrimidine dehydrogenase PreA subunit